MNKRDFDHIDKLAQDALKDFEADYSPQDWFEFEEKLEAEIQIDQQAADAFENFSVTHEAADWNAFEAILEKEVEKKKRFYPFALGLKGAEVGAIALFLFTFFNFNFSNSNQTNDNNSTLKTTITTNATATNDAAVSGMFTEQETTSSDASQNTAASLEDISETKNNTYRSDATSNSAQSKNYYTSTLTHQRNNNSRTIGTSSSTDGKKVNKSNVSSANNRRLTSTAIAGLLEGSEKSIGTGNNAVSNTTINQNTTNNTLGIASENTVAKEGTASIDGVPIIDAKRINTLLVSNKMLSAVSLKNNQIENKIVEPAFELKSVQQDKAFIRRIHIGGTASVDANIANSMGSTGVGYGAGVFVDIDLSKKFFIKTGALASYKKYLLEQNYLTDNSIIDGTIYEVEESKITNLVVVQIPADLNYIFFENEKWRAFASAGLSANLVASRFYEGTQSTVADNGFLINTSINSEGQERGSVEGGDLMNNFYLSVGGGIGLERQLGENISLYLLPSYRHAILPIGANKDRIGTFSFNVGIKTTIK
jgi:hypothetical protein